MQALKRLNTFYLPYIFYSFPVISFVYEIFPMQSNGPSILVRAIGAIIGFYFLLKVYRHRAFYKTVDFWLFIGFWIMYLPRLVYDITFQSEWLREAPFYYISFGIILSFFCAIPFFNWIPIDEEKMEKYIYILTIAMCAWGFVYALDYEYLFVARSNANTRMNEGTFTTIAIVPMAIATKYLLNPGSFRKKAFAFMAFLLAVACVLMSGTKGPMLFYCIFLLFFLRKRMMLSPIKTTLIFIGIVAIAIYIVIAYDLLFAFEFVIKRFLNPTSGDNSTSMRVLAWQGAINQFLESPIFGSAIEERITRQYPHNLILESFMAVGILGGVLFTILYFRLAIQVFYNLIMSNFSIVPMLCFLYFILSLFSGSLYGGTDFWAVLALSSVYKQQLLLQRKAASLAMPLC